MIETEDVVERCVELGAKQLYKDFENTTDEHVEIVFAVNADPIHRDLAQEMRDWFRAALEASGLSATPIERLREENARLRDALEPFAREADDWPDKMDCEDIPADASDVKIADLRNARAALNQQ